MERQFQIDKVIPLLKQHYHSVRTPVVDFIQAKTNDPFKVLVATILSARTKDETTAKVVTKLFERIDKCKDIEKFSEAEIDSMIYPVGFHRAKAKYLKELPAILEGKFKGRVPSEIEDLLLLPGVGRKTANLVRVIGFGLPAICVDVHVHRICNRWGYVNTRTPFETEMVLRQVLPAAYWMVFNSYVVAFGQNLCYPRKPRCHECPLRKHCARVGV